MKSTPLCLAILGSGAMVSYAVLIGTTAGFAISERRISWLLFLGVAVTCGVASLILARRA